jgi:hypothetical protein
MSESNNNLLSTDNKLPNTAPQKKKSNIGLWVALGGIGVAVAAAIIVVIVVFTKQASSSSNNNNTNSNGSVTSKTTSSNNSNLGGLITAGNIITIYSNGTSPLYLTYCFGCYGADCNNNSLCFSTSSDSNVDAQWLVEDFSGVSGAYSLKNVGSGTYMSFLSTGGSEFVILCSNSTSSIIPWQFSEGTSPFTNNPYTIQVNASNLSDINGINLSDTLQLLAYPGPVNGGACQNTAQLLNLSGTTTQQEIYSANLFFNIDLVSS